MIGKQIKKSDIGVTNFNGRVVQKCYVVVPNVGAIAREMAGASQVTIIIRKFLSLSLKNKLTLIFGNLVFLLKLLKMDYAVGIKLLCELEILKSREQKNNIRSFILHSQMVDMALALNNKRVFDYFFLLSKKYNFVPGLMTNNLDFFIRFASYVKNLPENLVIFTNISDQRKEVVDYLKISNIEFNDIYG